ncbi:5763_t:CDS:2 [Racocetra fulgida]|uniref:5763_t:CDS:1 n=1 Tax=Racocetra fulgida TaxID=60492 RepID=A0A9N9FZV3_9GLOM|nr:5763_t:CDS:2 [Racocetra fulgida]
MFIHSDFEISSEVWWKSHLEENNNEYVINKIELFKKQILSEMEKDDKNLWIGYMNYHREKYLLECISTEIDIKYDELQKLSENEFTQELVKRLHKDIGKEIIEDAGEYRTIYVKPHQEDFMYMDPILINDKLEELLSQCREKFKDELSLEDAVKYGACFLSQFLFIHPFSNGNEIYLQCLKDAQWSYELRSPSTLARFILECIYKTLYDICVIMDIDISTTE